MAAEAVRAGGWHLRDVLGLLVAKLEAAGEKEREVAVELRNTREKFVIAETKVETLREVVDRAPARVAPRRPVTARRMGRGERNGYDDYSQSHERGEYQEDTGYTGAGRNYPAERWRRSNGYFDHDEDLYRDYDRNEDPYRGVSSR